MTPKNPIHARAVELLRQGAGMTQVCRILHLTPQHVRRLAEASGVEIRKGASARALRAAAYAVKHEASVADSADAFGLHPHTVYVAMKQSGTARPRTWRKPK